MNSFGKVDRAAISRFAAYALSFLLSLLLPAALIVLQTGLTLSSRDRVSGILSQAAVESGLLPEGLAWFAKNRAASYAAGPGTGEVVEEPDIGAILDSIPADGWRRVSATLLTEEMLGAWASQTVDGVSAWLETGEKLPSVVWTLAPLRERLQTEDGRMVVAVGFAALPPCSAVQLEAFETRLLEANPGDTVVFEACQHPPPWFQEQFNAYLGSLARIAAGIGDQFDLTTALQQAENPQGVGVLWLKNGLRAFLWGRFLIPFVCLAILVAIRILIGRDRLEIGKTIGVSLSLGGSLSMLIAGAYPPVIQRIVASWVLSEVPARLHPAASNAFVRLSELVFPPVVLAGGVVLVVGVGIMLWGAGVLARRRPPP